MSDKDGKASTSDGERDDKERREEDKLEETESNKKKQEKRKIPKKRKTGGTKGTFIARAIKSKLRDRLERERLVGVSSSSSDAEDDQGKQVVNLNGREDCSDGNVEFEELNSSLLRQVADMVEEEERNLRENVREITPSVSSTSSSLSGMSSDLEVEKAIINMLDQEKTYSTPQQIDEEVIRQVVRRTERPRHSEKHMADDEEQ